MPDYIKRLQSRLSSKGLRLTRDQIASQMSVAIEDLNDSNIDLIVQDFLTNPNDSSIQHSSTVQHNQNGLEHSETNLNDTQAIEPYTTTSTSFLTVSEGQKQAQIVKTSQQLGIALIGSEVKEISQSIKSNFSNRREMLTTITNAITAYTQRIAEQEQEIINQALAKASGQLSESNQNIKQAFEDFQSDFETSNLDFKSFQADFLSIFAAS